MQGLTVKEMEELQEDIKMHLELDRATPTHIEFWEAVLKRLQIYKAKARLKEIHAELLHQHLRQLKESDSNEHQISKEEVDVGHDDEYTEEAVEDTGPYSPELVPLVKAVKELEEEPGSFSPKLLHDSEGEEGLDPEADKAELVMLITFTKLFS